MILKYEMEAGPDWIPSGSGSGPESGLWEALGYTVISICLSRFVPHCLWENKRLRCRKLRNYSIILFLLSLSAYSELTEIKMFTGINIAQSLHVCKRVLVWYPLAYLHGLKTEIFPTLRRNQLPPPPVSKTYRTVTPLCRIEPNREFCEPLHP